MSRHRILVCLLAVLAPLVLVTASCSNGDGTAEPSASVPITDGSPTHDCPPKPGTGVSSEVPAEPYEATLASLDLHGVPEWWRDAKFGIFIHWGPYSVPAYAPPGEPYLGYAEWYWYYQQRKDTDIFEHHLETYGPDVLYDEFIDRWTAESFEPEAWIDLFERAGARYFVLTSKHHDGVALWPTATSDRNTVAMGPHRDIVGDLLEAAECSTLRTGLYFSIPEWFNPAPRPALQRVEDSEILFTLIDGPARDAYSGEDVPYTGYREIDDFATGQVIPQVHELIDTYQPDILWCDIGGPEDYYRGNSWIADYFNKAISTKPEGVVVNDRCGQRDLTHSDFTTVEYGDIAELPDKPQEVTRGMGYSFGYNAAEPDSDLMGVEEIIRLLVDTVANNGNLLLNIGPRADGTIPAPMVERLEAVGKWLRFNGDAIYETRPWSRAADGDLRFTNGPDGTLYAISLGWPGDELRIGASVPVDDGTTIRLLVPEGWDDAPGGGPQRGSHSGPLDYQTRDGMLVVDTSGIAPTSLPDAADAYVFAISRT